MKNLILPFLTALLISSCTSNTKIVEGAQELNYCDFGNAIELFGEELVLEDPPLKFSRLYVADSVLFVFNLHSEYLYSLYNLNTKTKITDCFTFGNGPQDLIRPEIITHGNGLIWILDNQKRKLFSYDIESLYNNELSSNNEATFNNYMVYATLLDNKLASLVYHPNYKRITFYSLTGDSIKTVGDFPVSKDMGFMATLETNQCYITTNNIKDKIYLFYKRADLVEIYNQEGALIKRVHGPDHFVSEMREVDFGDGYTRVTPVSKESYEGYFTPVNVGNSFFVLYSGIQYRNDPDHLKNQILVFDELGNPLRRYTLNTPISLMTVDTINQMIYGITDQPEFRIIKFAY